jgi:prepilin peptidase CpaA
MTISAAALSHGVLLVTAGVLLYVALTDLRHFKIRNEMIMVLVALFTIHACLSGRWVGAHWNLALATFMFAVTLAFYSLGWVGGGDVKILAVGFLWVGVACALLFAVLLSIFAMLHLAATKIGWARVQQVDNRKRIPFAPSVAAALMVCFILGCLDPIS